MKTLTKLSLFRVINFQLWVLLFGISQTSSLWANASPEKLPIADLQRFTTAVEQIRNFYVKPVDEGKLFEDAIRGMLAGLDPHSSYLGLEEFEDLKVNTTGKFGGLGVEIIPEDGFIKVISPIDDTPAQRAGIQA
ncbi:MAG: family peptidase, partial [Francisellaceae bacterium]|nr:family peptidase [Francisellaceae bacterium]